MSTKLITSSANFSQTDFQGYSYMNVYIYGGGGGSSEASPPQNDHPGAPGLHTPPAQPCSGAGSGGYIEISNVPINGLTSVNVSVGSGGQFGGNGGNTIVKFTYSNGQSYTYTAGGGGGVIGSSLNTPGGGGQNSIPQPAAQIPGTICNSVNGAVGGSINSNGLGNLYTSSGSGSTSDATNMAGIPPKYTKIINNVTLTNQGSGSNLPSGYGSGGAGAPVNYTNSYRYGTSGAVVFYMQ